MDPSEINELIIKRLFQLIEAQNRAMRAMHESMKLAIETPNINIERFLSVAVVRSQQAIDDSEELTSGLRRLICQG